MSRKENPAVTLGDRLRLQKGKQRVGVLQILIIITIILLSAIISVLCWSTFEAPYPGIAAAMVCIFSIIRLFPETNRENHMLILADQQGFMASLRLSDKTVIFDGSNIYHFGLDNRVGRKALEMLIRKLRSDGFRIVCFFDANIYFTLSENGEFPEGSERFSIKILQRVFGLQEYEVYVVPTGIQADHFIVESLLHLPISFAVTNDRFRDYETRYDFLAKDNQWRKGLTIKQGQLLMSQYNFSDRIMIA